MSGINFKCTCGKTTRVEIPEIDRLRKYVKELEKMLSKKEKSELDLFAQMLGMKP